MLRSAERFVWTRSRGVDVYAEVQQKQPKITEPPRRSTPASEYGATGVNMGNYVSLYLTNPKGTPVPLTEPSFDPNLGFPQGRKERVMIATQEEMEAAKLPLEARDYCAHKLIQYRACRSDVWPWAYKCAHEKHEYLNCEYEDYILRLKEYEREKRLLQRKLKIEKKQAQELAA